jgi:hypothetical protein
VSHDACVTLVLLNRDRRSSIRTELRSNATDSCAQDNHQRAEGAANVHRRGRPRTMTPARTSARPMPPSANPRCRPSGTRYTPACPPIAIHIRRGQDMLTVRQGEQAGTVIPRPTRARDGATVRVPSPGAKSPYVRVRGLHDDVRHSSLGDLDEAGVEVVERVLCRERVREDLHRSLMAGSGTPDQRPPSPASAVSGQRGDVVDELLPAHPRACSR